MKVNLLTTLLAVSLPVAHSFTSPILFAKKLNPFKRITAMNTIAIVVDAEIKEDRMEEFLDIIEKDAVGSRAEPGCLRFDVLQSQEQSNRFFFYEIYKDAESVAFHKDQPHFALWTNFKASGGVISSVSHKTFGKFLS